MMALPGHESCLWCAWFVHQREGIAVVKCDLGGMHQSECSRMQRRLAKEAKEEERLRKNAEKVQRPCLGPSQTLPWYLIPCSCNRPSPMHVQALPHACRGGNLQHLSPITPGLQLNSRISSWTAPYGKACPGDLG